MLLLKKIRGVILRTVSVDLAAKKPIPSENIIARINLPNQLFFFVLIHLDLFLSHGIYLNLRNGLSKING